MIYEYEIGFVGGSYAIRKLFAEDLTGLKNRDSKWITFGDIIIQIENITYIKKLESEEK